MKRILFIFVMLLMVVVSFAPLGFAEEAKTNKHWFNPRMIKTYIPPNHKNTVMMKHAFEEWSRVTNDKVVFRYVTSPNTADLIVEFVTVIPNADREIGLTQTTFTSTNKIVKSRILIADKTVSGKTLGKDSVYTVMLHEIGHAMGIMSHSGNPVSIMYAYEDDVQEIQKSDIQTLYEIYGW